ncbi:uncharacterized protein METZ01_LOCUS63449 [marine metagenome]|uniref:Uncharacterized protein n=1 Tax=marine metagenome TaxID=408172 RepID=A0A381T314_9ZZZZ
MVEDQQTEICSFCYGQITWVATAEGYLSVGEIGHDLVSILGQFWQ